MLPSEQDTAFNVAESFSHTTSSETIFNLTFEQRMYILEKLYLKFLCEDWRDGTLNDMKVLDMFKNINP